MCTQAPAPAYTMCTQAPAPDWLGPVLNQSLVLICRRRLHTQCSYSSCSSYSSQSSSITNTRTLSRGHQLLPAPWLRGQLKQET